MLENRNIAQVSINAGNLENSPLYRVFETVRFEAKRYGVGIPRLQESSVWLQPRHD